MSFTQEQPNFLASHLTHCQLSTLHSAMVNAMQDVQRGHVLQTSRISTTYIAEMKSLHTYAATCKPFSPT